MNKLLKLIYQKRANYYFKKIKKVIKSSDKILDIGAGTCYIAEMLSQQNNITLVDVIDYNQTALQLKLYDGKNLPFKDNSFDIGLFVAVLHHTTNPSAIIKEAVRVCKKLIIIEEVYTGIFTRLQMDLWEWFWNKTSGITAMYNFHSVSEWMRIFEELKLTLIENHKFRNSLKNQQMRIFIVTK